MRLWLSLTTVLAAALAFAAAAASRPAAGIENLHLQYGPGIGQDLYVYPNPDPTNPEPIVVVVHGGGWSGGDATNVAGAAAELAGAGYVVFNVNFPLDSFRRPGYPMEQDNVVNATMWAIRHAADYGGDPAEVNLFGESSGGTLAARAGEVLNASGPRVKTVVSLSGRMTFVHFQADLGNDVGNGFNPAFNIPKYLGCTFVACPLELERAASPLSHVTARTPAFLLFNSMDEHMPIDQPLLMAAALRRHGRDVSLQLLPGTGHALTYFDTVFPQIEQFLARHR